MASWHHATVLKKFPIACLGFLAGAQSITVADRTLQTRSPIVAAAGGGVGGAVLLAISIIGVLFFLRRRRRPDKTTPNEMEMPNDIITPSVSPEPNTIDQPQMNDGASRSNDTYENWRARKISLSDLEALSEDKIRAEFKILEKIPVGSMTAGSREENKGKCRYKGLYPVDDYRVKLTPPAEGGTDFINASFIPGYDGDENAYIACQGPKVNTLNDFVLMLWQQKPSAIVMVTNLIEAGKEKCRQYWPEEKLQEQTYGQINMKVTSVETWADFTLRTLRLTMGSQTQTLYQFHYQSWPDHDVPEELTPFVQFYQRVKAFTAKSSQPLAVHCSAGIGRTGTFIGLDYLLAEAKRGNGVSPYDCVELMRQRRPKMIQTELESLYELQSQYIFLHRVLIETLNALKFSCTTDQISTRLEAYQSGSKEDYIGQEIQHIERIIKEQAEKYEAGKKPENVKKNRFPEILPDDRYRVFLSQSSDHSDYINAINLNGKKERTQLVVTQLPLEKTVSNFWQMIAEQKINTIVQLNTPPVPFYPMEGVLKCHGFEIQFMASNENNDCKEISLHISGSQREWDVTVFISSQWSDAQPLPPESSVVKLLMTMDSWQQRTGNQRVCVTCMDGAARCGLFVCAFNTREKLKVDQEVNVYAPVLLARNRRRQFINSPAQYIFLYRFLKEYAGGYTEYANFQ